MSWTNNLLILSESKLEEERHFYLKLTIKENYSKRELDRQITSSYYERYMLSNRNLLPTKAKTIDEDDYPNTRILDTYSLEFLDLPNEYTEKDLKNTNLNLKDICPVFFLIFEWNKIGSYIIFKSYIFLSLILM